MLGSKVKGASLRAVVLFVFGAFFFLVSSGTAFAETPDSACENNAVGGGRHCLCLG